MANDAQFFIGQKAFIEKDGKLLVLLAPGARTDIPGGKIRQGETDLDESLRNEVREETGLEIEIGKPFIRWVFKLIPGHPNAGKLVFLVGFQCRWKSGEVILSNDHTKFEWVDANTHQKYDDGSGHYRAIATYFNR